MSEFYYTSEFIGNGKKAFVVLFFGLILSAIGFATETWNYVPNVSALSKGKEKVIYAKIDGKNVENKIQLTITKNDNGTIIIQSGAFKLGKMPFASSFVFEIPAKAYTETDDGKFAFEKAHGLYKVLASKSDAYISGELSDSFCKFTLSVEEKKRSIAITFLYEKKQ